LLPNDSVKVIDAVSLYVSSIKSKEGHTVTQQKLQKFVNWAGPHKHLVELKPSEIGDYGEQALGNGGGAQAVERLQEVKKFLTFAKKKGMIEHNLAQHIRIRKTKTRARGHKTSDEKQTVELTADGHAQLVADLERFKSERAPIAAEIRRAAADKDVRENAPLEAAREQLGLLESRIRQIEGTLNVAVIADATRTSGQAVRVGSEVHLKNLLTNKDYKYWVVGASEAKPNEGKISDASPVGKALISRSAGQEVVVSTPRGTLKYKILKVV